MKTRKEMREKLKRDLMASASSTAFQTATLDAELDEAYSWARGLFYWEDLSDVKKTSANPNQEYYDYPASWKLGSIEFLYVDGLDYERCDYKDFYKHKLSDPSNLEAKRLFASHNKFYFIFPAPTAQGANNIVIMGNKQGDPMGAGDDDVTIFSEKYEEANEGIERKAFSSCIRRIDQALSQKEELAALAIMQTSRKKELDSKSSDRPLDRPFFVYKRFF